jgi:hypothetical protein
MSSIEGTCENPAETAISIQAIRFIFLNTTIRPYKNADNSRFSRLIIRFIPITAVKMALPESGRSLPGSHPKRRHLDRTIDFVEYPVDSGRGMRTARGCSEGTANRLAQPGVATGTFLR